VGEGRCRFFPASEPVKARIGHRWGRDGGWSASGSSL
jgi:hypothetical protein